MIRKRTTPSGKISWGYAFDAPGSTRELRRQRAAWGFATKREALDAEARCRLEAQAEHEAELRGASASPRSLAELLEEFFREHGDRNLAPKTIHRYREMAEYLDAAILAMPITEITSLHLTKEWNRLKDSGGHDRRTKTPRPLSSKSVRNIAGLVSTAFRRAVAWGLLGRNPTTDSDKPRGGRKEAAVLSVNQQALLLAAGEAHWALPMILELAAATGARRGEILALRWSDLADGMLRIGRSISQAGPVLSFKEPKTASSFRYLSLPASTCEVLERHRAEQQKLRAKFGPDYEQGDLMISNHDGSPLKPDSISSAVSALCRRLKLPKGVSLHTLRHTHGSHLIASGMEITAVSARLGHASPNITATVYAHALKGRDEESAKRWERFQGRGSAVRGSEKGVEN